MKKLSGYKTYFVGAAFVLWGAWQALVEDDVAGGAERAMAGIAILTGRAAIKKSTGATCAFTN